MGQIQSVQKVLVLLAWTTLDHDGGQGLVDIASRLVKAFKVQTMQMLLCHGGLSWLCAARVVAEEGWVLGYDNPLLLIQPAGIRADLTGLTPLYQSVLQAWQVFKATCGVPAGMPGMQLFQEPLF